PEQATGSAVDNRTDLFAIGTIAYEMLTGQNPFGAGQSADATTLIYRIVHQAAPSLPEAASAGLPTDIRPAVLAALNKNPQERPQDAASFKAMLNGAPAPPASSAPAPIMAPVTMVNAPTLQGQAATPSGSKKWLPYGIVGGIGVVAIVLVFAFASSGGSAGGGGMVSSGSTPPEETRVVADEEEGQGEAFYLTIMGGKVAVFQGSPGGSSSLDYITDIDASSLKPGSVSLLEEGVVATDLKTLNALLDVYKEEAAHTEPGASNTYHYVLPDSSSRYYARTELERLDSWELYIARNEVFARHGRGFMNEDLRNYFFGQPWYVQLYTPLEFDELPSPLNDYEKKNTELIRSIETARNSPYL
ncbi:MAG: BofC C-terminal domain-containing protein, partial [Coriobacteriia bacterium]|nr:BofC C-terminal domain-containing protein [Coriobacteriia bacterium]